MQGPLYAERTEEGGELDPSRRARRGVEGIREDEASSLRDPKANNSKALSQPLSCSAPGNHTAKEARDISNQSEGAIEATE